MKYDVFIYNIIYSFIYELDITMYSLWRVHNALKHTQDLFVCVFNRLLLLNMITGVVLCYQSFIDM